jgi:N-acylneuraminate cytidylyltransferase
MSNTVAIITARGGSKRIPRKNIRPFLGRPMIAYPIEAASQSGLFDRIVVSTDDAEIAEVALKCGAETPFMRPAELSDDHTATAPVVRHAIQWLRDNGQPPEYVCCIYPTAPFLTAGDLREGRAALRQPGCSFAFSVSRFGYPIQRALRRVGDIGVQPFFPESIPSRSQDLEPAYHDAGQFYWGTAQAFMDRIRIFGPASIPIVLPAHRVQDIDDEEDWRRAEYLYRAQRLAEEDSA